MKTKNQSPFLLLSGRIVDPVIRLYFQINHLKQLYREGWLKRGVSESYGESVADHIFAMAFLAMSIIDRYALALDLGRVLSMILVHEVGEVIIGDITPHDGMSEAEKHRLERLAVIHVLKDFPGGEEYLALWDEFEANVTAEARFSRQLDKLEMSMQASIYGLQHGIDSGEFFDSTEKVLHDPLLMGILDELRTLRPPTQNPAS